LHGTTVRSRPKKVALGAVATLGNRLMGPAPQRPSQSKPPLFFGPCNRQDEATYLRKGRRDQLEAHDDLPSCLRLLSSIVVRPEAHDGQVGVRQERERHVPVLGLPLPAPYSSRPTSPLACSKQSSTCHLLPATRISSSASVSFGCRGIFPGTEVPIMM
jgi:hypothetical protein